MNTKMPRRQWRPAAMESSKMNPRACCNCHGTAQGDKKLSALSRAVKACGWVLPGLVWVLIPKCPVCFAAWMSVIGISVSVSAAGYLRMGLMVGCGIAFILLCLRYARGRIFRFLKYIC